MPTHHPHLQVHHSDEEIWKDWQYGSVTYSERFNEFQTKRHRKNRDAILQQLQEFELDDSTEPGKCLSPSVREYARACRMLSILARPIIACSNLNETTCDMGIKMNDYGLSDAHAQALGLSLHHMPKIVRLQLSANAVGALGCQRIIENGESLLELNLSYNNLNKGAAVEIARQLLNPRLRLQRLELNDNPLCNGVILLSQALILNSTIRTLNLSNCQFSELSFKYVAMAIIANKTIRHLNLSWNRIGGENAFAIIVALEHNNVLESLELGHNMFSGTPILKLSTVIAEHRSLVRIGLRFNKLDYKSGIELANALRRNNRITHIDLRGNPLCSAARQIVHSIVKSETQRIVDLSHCIVRQTRDIEQPKVFFDAQSPGGHYEINLETYYEHALVHELFYTVSNCNEGIITKCTLDGTPFQVQFNNLSTLFLPRFGLLKFDVQSLNTRPRPNQILSANAFSNIVRMLSFHSHDQTFSQRFNILQGTCTDFVYSCDQVVDIIRLFPERKFKIDVVALLWMQVVQQQQREGHGMDDDAMRVVMNELRPIERIIVNRRMCNFSNDNPTGRYTIDLSNEFERAIALRLAYISNDERRFILKHNDDSITKIFITELMPKDWSQNGTMECWRNETLNVERFIFTPNVRLPNSGILQVDFVVHRSHSGVDQELILPEAFSDLVTDLQWILDTIPIDVIVERLQARWMMNGVYQNETCACSNLKNGISNDFKDATHITNGEIALDVLRSSARNVYFLVEQTELIIRIFQGSDMHKSKGVDAFVALYSKTINPTAIRKLIHLFDRNERYELMQRLGFLALVDLVHPSGSYRLDLSHADARKLTRILLHLRLVENKTKFTNERFDNQQIVAPAVWILRLPIQGVYELDFIQGTPCWPFRQSIALNQLGFHMDLICE